MESMAPIKDKAADEKLIKVKFIGVEFDYNKYEAGENQINNALGDGYTILGHHQTGSGLVIVLGLYGGEQN